MLSRKKLVSIIISITILITNLASADWKENAKVIKVSGGEDHVLVLTTNKWPWGCGRNDYFQLGIGNTSEQWTLARVHGPNDVGRLENINDVAAGFVHSLALDANDMVWAWGWNDKGQLGDNQQSLDHSATPIQVHGVDNVGYLRHIIAISAGRSGEHSLAVDANNFVYAWGQNVNGQCGNGTLDCNEYTPVRVHGVQTETTYLEDIIDVSAGVGHSMALGKLEPGDPNLKGRVYTWGNNFYGQLGNGSNYLSTTPVRVLKGEQDTSTSDYLENIVSVKAGWDHCVALEDYYPFDPNCKGRVYTWGRNIPVPSEYWTPSKDGGQLGNGNNTTNENSPVCVLSGEQNPDNPDSYLKGIVAIGAGDVHSMALDVNGFVYAWGSNYFGQLGNGTYDPCTRPVRVVGPDTNHNGIHDPNEGYLGNIVAISAALYHCLAIDANGNIWTWGRGYNGRLGTGDIANRNIPHRISVVYNITQEKFYFGIQNALNDANNDDIIEASIGAYYEEIIFPSDKHITLRSTNPDNPSVVANTIINGSNQDSSDLITLYPNPGSTIAGFTITNSCQGGLVCIDSYDVSIKNCIIKNNQNKGIYLWDATANITNCCIQNNGQDGIRVVSDLSTTIDITITNNIIRSNGGYGGIYLQDIYSWTSSSATIKNNWIHNNSSDGIYCQDVSITPVIRNNTIVHNAVYGINCSSSTAPVISNCIIWGNISGQLYGCNATYSCIQNGGTDNHDINTPPCFFDADANNFHLSPAGSPCIDAGDPNGYYEGETDIDGENRKVDGDSNGTEIVDMGADEYYWSSADFNDDGFVNFIDYAIFADAWQNQNSNRSLDGDSDVDIYDLKLFCEDWLWQAGWAKSFTYGVGEGMSQAMAGGFAPAKTVSSEQPFDSGLRAESQIEKVEPVKIEQMIKWLEEIWLDPEARELIDEDTWLKFIESVASELK